jgi:arylsulfatase A-like enzyme
LRVPLIISGVPGAPANQIHHSLTHVNDIVPTLLDLAQLPHPGSSYKGQAIEPLAGRSLMPALRGEAGPIHPVDHPIGYELSGNQAPVQGRPETRAQHGAGR